MSWASNLGGGLGGMVGGLFGGSGGANYQPGSQFVQESAMPQGTDILNPMDIGNANQAHNNVLDSIQRQQAFVNAAQMQGGFGNQSDYANMLQQQMAGNGPNPALAQLAMTTGQNIHQQAGMMAGQRGVSQNVGTMGMNIANQGSTIQQQAAGQAAAMRANQMLAAQQQFGQLANQQIGNYYSGLGQLGNMAQTEQGQVLGSIAAGNQSNVSMQSNINNARMQGAGVNAGMQGNMNTVKGGLAQQNAGFQGKALAGVAQAAGPWAAKALGGLGSSPDKGSETPEGMQGYALGGEVEQNPRANPIFSDIANYSSPTNDPNGPQSDIGKQLYSQPAAAPSSGGGDADSGFGGLAGGILGGAMGALGMGASGLIGLSRLKTGGKGDGSGIPDMSKSTFHMPEGGEGENIGPQFEQLGKGLSTPNKTLREGPHMPTRGEGRGSAYSKGGNVGAKLKSGGGVPGQAKMSGDSLQNDTVSARLSPGEIVIPRHITMRADAPKKAAEFVAAILAKKGGLARGK